MTHTTTARIPTSSASKYLQQLCKHWSHKMETEFTPETGRVVFPRDIRGNDWPDVGVLTMTAQEDALECRLEASVDAQLQGLKGAVERHLDRFAFRELPLTYDWQDAPAS